MLKPIYGWVTPEAEPADKRQAVVRSDNEATDRIVVAAGGTGALRGRLRQGVGVGVAPAATWGRFLVSDRDVAAAYQVLAGADSAAEVLGWMRHTPRGHRFGCDEVLGTLMGVRPERVAVKAGWDLSDDEPFARTRVVMVVPGRVLAVSACTPVNTGMRALWERTLATGGPDAVAALHEEWAGAVLRAAVTCRADTDIG